MDFITSVLNSMESPPVIKQESKTLQSLMKPIPDQDLSYLTNYQDFAKAIMFGQSPVKAETDVIKPGKPTSYKCDLCGKIYFNRKSYVNHKHNHKRNKKSGKHPFCKDKIVGTTVVPNTSSEEPKLSSVIEESSAEKQLQDSEGDMKTDSNVIMSDPSLGKAETNVIKLEKPSSYKCDICDKNFLNRKTYLNHKKNHKRNRKMGMPPFFKEKTIATVVSNGSCKEPRLPSVIEGLSSAKQLQDSAGNIKTDSNQQKSYKCTLCGRIFLNKKSFTNHKYNHEFNKKGHKLHVYERPNSKKKN